MFRGNPFIDLIIIKTLEEDSLNAQFVQFLSSSIIADKCREAVLRVGLGRKECREESTATGIIVRYCKTFVCGLPKHYI